MKRKKGNQPTPTTALLLPLCDEGSRVGVPGLRGAEDPGRGENALFTQKACPPHPPLPVRIRMEEAPLSHEGEREQDNGSALKGAATWGTRETTTMRTTVWNSLRTSSRPLPLRDGRSGGGARPARS